MPELSPLPPEVLADALQDSIHKDLGVGRPVRAVRVSREDLERLRAMGEQSERRLARLREIEKELGLENPP